MNPRFKIILTLLVLAAMFLVFLLIPMFLVKNRKRWKPVFTQEPLTRLLVEKGIFTKEEFLEMVGVVNFEIERKS